MCHNGALENHCNGPSMQIMCMLLELVLVRSTSCRFHKANSSSYLLQMMVDSPRFCLAPLEVHLTDMIFLYVEQDSSRLCA